MNLPSHGANPHYLYEQMDITPPQQIIDFSANINPLGPPAVLQQKWASLYNTIHYYPDPKGRMLIKNIADIENIKGNQLLLGNGAAELISLIGRMLTGEKVLLIQPTFSEYEQACKVNNCEVNYHMVNDKDWLLQIEDMEASLKNVKAVFLCNPNNPTGIYYEKKELLRLLDVCKKYDCLLILDEAFYDFVKDYEKMAPELKHYPNLLILRSMTKMFSIPGIRLGYIMAHEQMIKKLASLQTHWSVNNIALHAGELLLAEEDFVADTIQFIETEKQKLCAFYKKIGFQMTESHANFYLLKDPNFDEQKEFFQFLLKEGIVARHTYNYPGLDGKWLRFAIKNKQENEHLQGVIKKWINNRPLFLSLVE
ncbi:threonine-phosphate decarboxylase CobD [Niallia sp. 01092]|uniref:threonine-phosphate decarboxylase CobD n=1 Tax=unclassified Niallia TaxID=2837522 RepID=UPI003FD5C0B2